jgi:hypothetical protein
MSTRRELLDLFMGGVATSTSEAPDQFPDWHPGWSFKRDQILADWTAAKSMLKKDLDKAALIDTKLAEAIACFDQGQREPGRSLMWEIYNVLNLNTLR